MRKVLIANRGEIACRVLRSCRKLGLATVAVHSEADAHALHVALADQAIGIGPPPAAQSYLRGDEILRAAHATGADAIHPGYGFLAENHEFAAAAEREGLLWIGPDPKTIEAMGDKERARQLALAAGVPILPGSARFAPGAAAGLPEMAETVGFPLLVKAASGGGGIGMRRVASAAELAAAVEATQSMAQRAFGDGTVYLESFIAEARHVEVQVFGFGDGRAVHLFERDCSMQRRFQKIVEETPAPGLSQTARAAMCDAAVALCRQERYRGAGTVEFIVDAHTERFWFLEMNTRIQVEHPVTEMTTGLDLVAMQLQLAGGLPLPIHAQPDVKRSGHAIECRVYAERPAKGFLPSPGMLATLRLPQDEAGVRVDAGVREGDIITHWYDPLIAKIIVHAPDRAAAIERMLSALHRVETRGVETNVAFLRRALAHPSFASGSVRTSFIDTHRTELLRT